MRRFLSSLLYLVLGLPLALSALLLAASGPWALDRDFYKRFVTDERLYEALRSPEIAREQAEALAIGEAVFHGPSLVAAAQRHLPEAELKALGSAAVDRALDLVEGKAQGGMELDLRPLKEAMRREVPAIAGDYALGLPTRAELPPPGDYSFRSEALPPATVTKNAAAALDRAVEEEIPDRTVGKVAVGRVAVDQAARRELRITGGSGLSQAALNRATLVTASLAALLLGGLALLGGGGAAAVLARAGTMLGLPSALVLVVGVALALPGASIVERLALPSLKEALGGEASAAIRAYLATVLGTMSRSFFLTGLVGASLAGLLSSLKRIFEPKEL